VNTTDTVSCIYHVYTHRGIYIYRLRTTEINYKPSWIPLNIAQLSISHRLQEQRSIGGWGIHVNITDTVSCIYHVYTHRGNTHISTESHWNKLQTIMNTTEHRIATNVSQVSRVMRHWRVRNTTDTVSCIYHVYTHRGIYIYRLRATEINYKPSWIPQNIA